MEGGSIGDVATSIGEVLKAVSHVSTVSKGLKGGLAKKLKLAVTTLRSSSDELQGRVCVAERATPTARSENEIVQLLTKRAESAEMVADNLKWRLEEASKGAGIRAAALEKELEMERARRHDAEHRALRPSSPPQRMMDEEPRLEPSEIQNIRRSLMEDEGRRIVAEHQRPRLPSSQYVAMEV